MSWTCGRGVYNENNLVVSAVIERCGDLRVARFVANPHVNAERVEAYFAWAEGL